MDAQDYVNGVMVKNRQLFVKPGQKITMTNDEFKKQLKSAFEAGKKVQEASKSIFEKVFGS